MADLDRLQRLAAEGDQDAAQALIRAAARERNAALLPEVIPRLETIPPGLAPMLAWYCGPDDAPRVFAALPARGCALEARRLTCLCLQREDAEIMVIEARSQRTDTARPARRRALLNSSAPNGISGHPSLPRYWIDPHGAHVPLVWGQDGVRHWAAACCAAAADDEIAERHGGDRTRAMLRTVADVLTWRLLSYQKELSAAVRPLAQELSAAVRPYARMAIPMDDLAESIMRYDHGARRGYGPLHLASLLRCLGGTREVEARQWTAQRRALAEIMAAPPTPIERAAGNPAWQADLFEEAA